MAFELNKVMEANKTDDGYNVENIMKAIDNEYVNPIVAKNKPDIDKINSEYLGTVMKDLGINGNTIDEMKVWTKQMGGNTDEIKEQNLTLTTNFKELEVKYNDINEKYGIQQKDLVTNKQVNKIISSGFEADDAEFIQYKLSKQVTEENTFDSLLEDYAKDKQKTKTDNKFVKTNFKKGESEFTSAYKAQKKY